MIRVLPHSPTMGENYLINAGAEDPLATVWGSYFGCPRTQVTEDKHSGANSVRCDTNSATNRQGVIVYQMRAQNTGTFQTGAWVKGPAGVAIRAMVRLSPGAGEVGQKDTTLTGAWQFVQSLTVSLTNRVTGPHMPSAEIYLAVPASGVTFYVDDVEVRQTSTA